MYFLRIPGDRRRKGLSQMSVNIFIRDAVKKYGENTVIQDLTLDIHGGEFLHCWGLPDAERLRFCA